MFVKIADVCTLFNFENNNYLSFQLQLEAGSGDGPGPPVNNNTEGAVASPPRDDNHNAQLTTTRATPLTPSG